MWNCIVDSMNYIFYYVLYLHRGSSYFNSTKSIKILLNWPISHDEISIIIQIVKICLIIIFKYLFFLLRYLLAIDWERNSKIKYFITSFFNRRVCQLVFSIDYIFSNHKRINHMNILMISCLLRLYISF